MADFDEETARLEAEIFKFRVNFWRAQLQRHWLDVLLLVSLVILAFLQPPVFAVLLALPIILLRAYFLFRRSMNNVNRLRVKHYARKIKEAKGSLFLHQERQMQNHPSE